VSQIFPCTPTELFKVPKKKLTQEELESEHCIHNHKLNELQKLIDCSWAAIKQIQAHEVIACSERKVPANAECTQVRKAAEEQKQACQEWEQKRQQLVQILVFLYVLVSTNSPMVALMVG